ncbi:MAG: hypothetical protein C5S40_00110 [ANME-2 cluster archaeon]|nr:hypothetical protein [ANME-2 cluster archaeon]
MAKAVVSVMTALEPFSLVSYSVVRDSRSGYLAWIRFSTLILLFSTISSVAMFTMDMFMGTLTFQ